MGRSEGMGMGRSEGMGMGRSDGMGMGRSDGMGMGRSEDTAAMVPWVHWGPGLRKDNPATAAGNGGWEGCRHCWRCALLQVFGDDTDAGGRAALLEEVECVARLALRDDV